MILVIRMILVSSVSLFGKGHFLHDFYETMFYGMDMDTHLAVIKNLTTEEMTRKELQEKERVIERGRQSFIEVGNALRDVRDRRGYRFGFKTFDEYCKVRWEWDVRNASYYISAADVVNKIGTQVPNLEFTQARELSRLSTPSDNGDKRKKEIDFKLVKEVAKEIDFAKATVKQVASAVDSKLREVKRQEQSKRVAALPPAPKANGNTEIDTITVCDIADVRLDPNSIDMIFTDPPYHDEYLQCYSKLAGLAMRVLKPGAYCLTYVGKMFLPEIMDLMRGAGLEYIWQFVVFHPFSQSRITKHHIFENYRPILAFRKPGNTNTREWIQDVVRGTRDKDSHEWQQDEDAPRQYIAAYTLPGEIILDPFVGGGTTTTVCKELSRHYIAFDKDEEAVRVSIGRTNERHSDIS